MQPKFTFEINIHQSMFWYKNTMMKINGVVPELVKGLLSLNNAGGERPMGTDTQVVNDQHNVHHKGKIMKMNYIKMYFMYKKWIWHTYFRYSYIMWINIYMNTTLSSDPSCPFLPFYLVRYLPTMYLLNCKHSCVCLCVCVCVCLCVCVCVCVCVWERERAGCRLNMKTCLDSLGRCTTGCKHCEKIGKTSWNFIDLWNCCETATWKKSQFSYQNVKKFPVWWIKVSVVKISWKKQNVVKKGERRENQGHEKFDVVKISWNWICK